ncbi:MAG: BlaI/MecI/CopY family transcriptional regulator [Oscillospiraceae bacterium]|nr:BlaI/MecI/CopY family transcriptional regulator [Oscillospiraceae bacterium]MBR2889677.1 BlaI/MecI/CopY family transcriptional regulator [Oscillospiraceae bacterium]
MNIPKIPEGEYRFCLLMWEHEPVTASEMVKLCQEKLAWKRTTTYTVIKRLGERGVLKLENGIVTSLISKEQAEKAEIETLVESRFGGSLPAFVAAFTKHQNLSEAELDEVQSMIDRIRRRGGEK